MAHSPMRSVAKRRKLNPDLQIIDKKPLIQPNRIIAPVHNSAGILTPGKIYYPRSLYDPYVECFSVSAVRTKFPNMYIPSTFTHAVLNWRDSFPIESPLITSACRFHVMDKSVNRLYEEVSSVPDDINFRYNVKVMLLHCPDMTDVIKETCESAQNSNGCEHLQRQSKLIRFLVGLKGVNELVGIGGYWSPSLDGPDPDSDPGVLIRTAIRCTKLLTDIDLSSCTQWYKFLEINYLRPEKMHKNISVPEHIETTVIFIPDVWNCMPSQVHWKELIANYKTSLEMKLSACKKQETFVSNADEIQCEEGGEVVITVDEVLGDSNDSETEKNKETNNPTILTDADVEKLKECYKLPSEPAIIVHPSRFAKTSKFDCCLISLYTLLDYSMDDTKEHTFELSMFGECFDEMLSRDHAFRILKTLTSLKITPCASKIGESFNKAIDKSEDIQANSMTASRKRLHSSTVMVSKNGEEKPFHFSKTIKNTLVEKFGYFVDAKAYETTDPLLLLSFCYFDLMRCNVIKSKHLSNILFMTGLGLTRTEVTKYVNNVSIHSLVYYRNLTDGPVDGPPFFQKVDVDVIGSILSRDDKSSSKCSYKEICGSDDDALISIEGKTLDLKNTLSLLEKMTDSKSALETKLTKLELDLDAAKKLNKDNEYKNKKLTSEMSSLKRQLTDTERSLSRAKNGYSKYKRCVYHTRKVLKTLIHDDFLEILGPDEIKRYDTDENDVHENINDVKSTSVTRDHRSEKHQMKTKEKDSKATHLSNSDNDVMKSEEGTNRKTSDHQTSEPDRHHVDAAVPVTYYAGRGSHACTIDFDTLNRDQNANVNTHRDDNVKSTSVPKDDCTQAATTTECAAIAKSSNDSNNLNVHSDTHAVSVSIEDKK